MPVVYAKGTCKVLAIAPQPNRSSHTLKVQKLDRLPADIADSDAFTRLQMLQAIVEGFVDGVIIMTQQGQVLKANARARRLSQSPNLRSSVEYTAQIPAASNLSKEIWRVCQSLIESRRLFPQDKIIPESEITLENSTTLRIRVQWIELESAQAPCLLVMLEDRVQTIQNLVISDTQKYHLTPREREVWQLRLRGFSYREIASRLYITENTVKRHVKSILAKRRDVLEYAAS
ncbi:MAG: helix-turn-helix transcriptional regulator [Cyanothece sp. SIO1E1]|nr:helix-turn-helix transcriptional regulator [Cyanothece sp. SIO1E1]